MNRFVLSLFCLTLIGPSIGNVAHATNSVESIQAELIERNTNETLTIEQIQKGIDFVRANATEEEIKVLDSIQDEVDQIKPKKKIGKIAAKIGLALNRALFKSMTPFIYGSAYVKGRLEKKNRFNDQTDNKLINLLSKIGNILRNKGEIAASEIADRIVRGENVTGDEIYLLTSTFPKLDMNAIEGIATMITYGTSISVGIKVLTAAGLSFASPLLAVSFLTWYVSIIPCMVSDSIENPSEGLKSFCDQQLEDSYTIYMKARIRGYLRGIRDRNNAESN